MKYPLQNYAFDTIATVGGIDDNDTSFTLGSGNFDNTTGTQKAVIILDYDVEAKREIVTCTISGTSVSGLTRALGDTSAVAHAQNANIFIAFTSLHYNWLANAIQDGWVDALETWTYASATTFTVAADITTILDKGDKIRLKQGGGYKYFYVLSVSYSNPNTTVTVTGGSDYSLANSAITDNYYSKAETPNGFPIAFTWAPAPGGFTGAVTVATARFSIVGRYVKGYVGFSGTSNNTGKTLTLPVAPQNSQRGPHARVTDNSSALDKPGYVDMAAGVTAGVAIYKDLASNGWTASGTCQIEWSFLYEMD